jgi:hypothetical protein
MSKELLVRKTGIEIIPAAFTDHHDIVTHTSIPNNEVRRRRGRWRMDPTLTKNACVRDTIRKEWAKWWLHKHDYPHEVMWWEQFVKKQLQRLIRQEETERHRKHRLMENHLYDCIYDILRSNAPETEKLPALQRYEAKLVRLHATRRDKILPDTQDHGKIGGEEPSLFHVLNILRRREVREIRQVQDSHGNIHSTPNDITATFVSHLRQKYTPIDMDGASMAILQNFIHPACPTKYAELLEQPITAADLLTALRPGPRHKAPGIDGLCLEFYTANWETNHTELLQLLNQMFLHKNISPQQKHGVVICLSYSNSPHTPDGYRPIFLLTAEYKILAPIPARRLRHILADQLQNSQFCSVPGNSILDDISTVRDVLAHAETTGTPYAS